VTPFAFCCPKCGSVVLVLGTKPDLLRDGYLWVVRCGEGHLVTPVESDELRIEFG
jgi:hypothetical protein